jgi:hypothetical protein
VGLALVVIVGWTTTGWAASPAGALSLKGMMTQADLVFRGTVEQIEYRLSEPTGPTQVRLPYTYVTYRIDQVVHGKAPGPLVILQFLGGLNEKTGRYMATSQTPQFNVGDQDILFVQGNTARPSPLVGNQQGRLRVIAEQVYTETGRAVLLAHGGTLWVGARYRLPEVETTTVQGRVLMQRTPGPDALALPSEAAQAADILAELATLAGQVPPPREFANADITQPVAGSNLPPVLPPAGRPGERQKLQLDEAPMGIPGADGLKRPAR